jgi:hypothetical protein
MGAVVGAAATGVGGAGFGLGAEPVTLGALMAKPLALQIASIDASHGYSNLRASKPFPC